jgi:2'-5' RNA ligase
MAQIDGACGRREAQAMVTFSVSSLNAATLLFFLCSNFRCMIRVQKMEQTEAQMSGGVSGNFEGKNLFSGSKLILLAQPSEDMLDLIRQTARDLSRRHGLTGRHRPDDVLHVSIAGFGPYKMIPFAQVNALRHILSRLEFSGFDIYFDRAASFQGSYENPLVLYSDDGNQALIELERSVGKLLEPYFGKPAHGTYRPHMTLLYDRRKIVAEWIEAPIRWRVRELVLVESLQGQTEYHSICTFPCREPQMAARWRLPTNQAFRSAAAVPW